MERVKFEESFKEAFMGAEVAPSEAVWTNVELVLEKNSGGKMKGRLLFFQLLAAASMVFAMGVGSIYFLEVPNNHTPTVSQNTPLDLQKNDAPKNAPVLDNVIEESSVAKSGNPGNQRKSLAEKSSRSKVGAMAESKIPNTQFAEHVVSTKDEEHSEKNLSVTTRLLPKLVEIKDPTLTLSDTQPDPGLVMLAKLRDEEKKYQKEKSDKNKDENLWTSLGMSAGTFNPNASSPVSSSAAFGTSAVASNPSAGSSYSVGIHVGGRISSRIVIQGGVSYLTQNAEYTSSTANGDLAALNEFASVNNDQMDVATKMVATSPYQVNSNLQYVSVPVQAGYIILDKAFAIQINGGIATDIFIQNTLRPENSDFEKVTQGAGSDSPYRTLNFSGLVGTELSYRVGTHYRIAVNPGLRYALNSIYKTEVAAQVSPVTYDVGVRFRYIFN